MEFKLNYRSREPFFKTKSVHILPKFWDNVAEMEGHLLPYSVGLSRFPAKEPTTEENIGSYILTEEQSAKNVDQTLICPCWYYKEGNSLDEHNVVCAVKMTFLYKRLEGQGLARLTPFAIYSLKTKADVLVEGYNEVAEFLFDLNVGLTIEKIRKEIAQGSF